MKINELELAYPQSQELSTNKQMQVSQIPDSISVPYQVGQDNPQLALSGLLYALDQTTSDDVARQFSHLCANHRLMAFIATERNEGLYSGWYYISNGSVTQLPNRFDRPFSCNVMRIHGQNLITFISGNPITLDSSFDPVSSIYLLPLPSGVAYSGKSPVLIGGSVFADFLLDADLDTNLNANIILEQPDPMLDNVWEGQCIAGDSVGLIRNIVVNFVGDITISNDIIRLKWVEGVKQNRLQVFNGSVWVDMGDIEITASGELAIASKPTLKKVAMNEIVASFYYTISSGLLLEVIFTLRKAHEFFHVKIKTGTGITVDEIRINNTPQTITRLFNGVNESLDPLTGVAFSGLTNVGIAQTSTGYVGFIYTGQGVDHPNAYPPGDTANSTRWGRTIANETIAELGILAVSVNSNTHEDNTGTPSDLGGIFKGNAYSEVGLV